ncbi:Basal body-orientation factor 1, partial [Geodia barretti]
MSNFSQPSAREKNEMDSQFRSTATEMEEQLQERTEELAVIQGELRTVKEFRKRRAELEAELARLKQSLTDSEQDHQRTLQALEQRVFEEKVRLQKEANRRIAELSERAHCEAVRNLGERTREVYRENLQMSEALALHAARVQELETRTEQLEAANRELGVERDLSGKLLASRVQSVKQYQQQISLLQEKVSSLEASLVTVVREFDEEREKQASLMQRLLQEAREETESQCCRADREAAELAHVRSMARRILEQRSEVEHFLLEALQQVKKEVAGNRSQYCQNAAVAYRTKIREATRGHTHYPAVRTFRAFPESTNSVYHDLTTASTWSDTPIPLYFLYCVKTSIKDYWKCLILRIS